MTSGAEFLFAQLDAVHRAAGTPTQDYVARHCRVRRPDLEWRSSTVNDWLLGKSVPSEKSEPAFLCMVALLQETARRRDDAYHPRAEAAWRELLLRARAAKAANRGGRSRRKPGTASAAATPSPMTLPADPPDFTGRTAALHTLLERLDPAAAPGGAATTVTGMGGVGKTALAVHAAHLAHRQGRFTGGVLFVDLAGFSPGRPTEPGETAERLLRALGTGRAALPATPEALVGRWRTVLSALERERRPVLVVFDNAATAAQVRPLLPDLPHHAVITSRSTLSALPARRVEVPPLDPQEGVELLGRALRRTLPDDDRAQTHPADARRLTDLCGHLPLALRIVAALLADEEHRTLADQAADLAQARERLDRLRYDDADEHGRPLAVRAAFDLSYGRLAAEQARAFALLGAFPVPDTGLAAACAVLDRDSARTRELLSGLARLHLLQGHPGARWDMHDLIRLYAQEHARARPGAGPAALDRLFDHYRGGVRAANRWVFRGGRPPADRFTSRDEALAWLDDEHRGITAVIAALHESECWDAVCALALPLADYWELRRRTEEWTTTATAALEAAEHLGDERVLAALVTLGNGCRLARRYDEAVAHLRRAIPLAPDRNTRGRVLHNLGLTWFRMGEFAKAETLHRNDLRICQDTGDVVGAAKALVALGDAVRARKAYPEAAHILEQAIEAFRLLDDAGEVMAARVNLALTLMQWRPHQYSSCAVWHLCHALRTARELDDHHGQSQILLDLAAVFTQACPACHGRIALKCATTAASLSETHQDPYGHAMATVNTGHALHALGDLPGARRQMEQARAAFAALGDARQAARIAGLLATAGPGPGHIPGCRGRAGSTWAWLEDLPREVLRGDHVELDALTFVSFRHAVRSPAPRTAPDTGTESGGGSL